MAQFKGLAVGMGVRDEDPFGEGGYKMIANESSLNGCAAELIRKRREVQKPALFERRLVFGRDSLVSCTSRGTGRAFGENRARIPSVSST